MLLAGNSCPYCHLCPFETLTNTLTEYWQCEHAGVDLLCNRLRALLEEQKTKTLAYVLLWIFPAVNLIMSVN